MKRNILIISIIIVCLVGVYFFRKTNIQNSNFNIENEQITENSMKITSPVFENNELIHPKYTCDDQDINPRLDISDIPTNAKSLALIMDDPDAPAKTWVHWTLWNIDPSTSSIFENSIPKDAIQGNTSFGKPGYGGPCPPSGMHRYFFKLYALDTMLDLSSDSLVSDLMKAMEGHIVASTELIGLYTRDSK